MVDRLALATDAKKLAERLQACRKATLIRANILTCDERASLINVTVPVANWNQVKICHV